MVSCVQGAVDANALTEAANEKGLVEKNLPLLSASQIVVFDYDKNIRGKM